MYQGGLVSKSKSPNQLDIIEEDLPDYMNRPLAVDNYKSKTSELKIQPIHSYSNPSLVKQQSITKIDYSFVLSSEQSFFDAISLEKMPDLPPRGEDELSDMSIITNNDNLIMQENLGVLNKNFYGLVGKVPNESQSDFQSRKSNKATENLSIPTSNNLKENILIKKDLPLATPQFRSSGSISGEISLKAQNSYSNHHNKQLNDSIVDDKLPPLFGAINPLTMTFTMGSKEAEVFSFEPSNSNESKMDMPMQMPAQTAYFSLEPSNSNGLLYKNNQTNMNMPMQIPAQTIYFSRGTYGANKNNQAGGDLRSSNLICSNDLSFSEFDNSKILNYETGQFKAKINVRQSLDMNNIEESIIRKNFGYHDILNESISNSNLNSNSSSVHYNSKYLLDNPSSIFNPHNNCIKDKNNSDTSNLDFKFSAIDDFNNGQSAYSGYSGQNGQSGNSVYSGHSGYNGYSGQNGNHSGQSGQNGNHSGQSGHNGNHSGQSGHTNLFELIDKDIYRKDNIENIDNDIKQIEGI